jgi:hypothetical protein
MPKAEVTNYSITWSAGASNDSGIAQARWRLRPTTLLSKSWCAPQQIGAVDFRLGSRVDGAPARVFLTLLQHWSGAVTCPAC